MAPCLAQLSPSESWEIMWRNSYSYTSYFYRFQNLSTILIHFRENSRWKLGNYRSQSTGISDIDYFLGVCVGIELKEQVLPLSALFEEEGNAITVSLSFRSSEKALRGLHSPYEKEAAFCPDIAQTDRIGSGRIGNAVWKLFVRVFAGCWEYCVSEK